MISLILSNYIVNIYGLNLNENELVQLNTILDTKEYPKNIIEELENNNTINKIEIFSKDGNTLLLTNNRAIE